MADATRIEWADSTFNPWMGCTQVSQACDNCYAERDTRRFGRVMWGPGAPRVRTAESNWRKPLQWNAKAFFECAACGWRGDTPKMETHVEDVAGRVAAHCPLCDGRARPSRRRVFCASLADVFDNEVDPAWRADLFGLIARTPNLDWLLLTKRIGNAASMLPVPFDVERTYRHVWIGATICSQAEAERDILKLLATEAAVRFLSIEPMLGPIDLSDLGGGVAWREVPSEYWIEGFDTEDSPPALRWDVLEGRKCQRFGDYEEGSERIDWVICGGESGPQARPLHPEWVRSLRDQCAEAKVPFLFKQWGEWRSVGQGPDDWYSDLYRSRRTAREGENQGVLDEMWGRTLTVPDGVIHLDGSVRSNLDDGAWLQGTGAVLTLRVGRKRAGRELDGREHVAFPE